MLARPVVKSVNTTPCGSTGRAVRLRLFVFGAIMSHPNSAMRNCAIGTGEPAPREQRVPRLSG